MPSSGADSVLTYVVGVLLDAFIGFASTIVVCTILIGPLWALHLRRDRRIPACSPMMCIVYALYAALILLSIFIVFCKVRTMIPTDNTIYVNDYWTAFRALTRMALVRPEVISITPESVRRLAIRPSLPVHFVITLSATAWPHPSWLKSSQRCAVEAALRLADSVTVWVSGTDLSVNETVWASWRHGLDNDASKLGILRVKAHSFSPSTTIGAWVHLRTATTAYSVAGWGERGLPTGGSFASDMIRLDVLERYGGIYLDADVIVLSRALFHLPDGLALQAPMGAVGPLRVPLPFDRRWLGSFTSLAEMLNVAVLISGPADADAPSIARAISRVSVRQLETFGPKAWSKNLPFGPRAATDAWASGLLDAPFAFFDAVAFGYHTCGMGHSPDRVCAFDDSGKRKCRWRAASEWQCISFSASDLPIDSGVNEREYADFRRGRLAQHGIKHLVARPARHRGRLSVRQRLQREQCRATDKSLL